MDREREYQLMSGILAVMVGGGAQASYQLTNGVYTGGGVTNYGYSTFSGQGLLSPTGFLGSQINVFLWNSTGGGTLTIGLTNTAIANAGWTSVTIGTTTFTRAAATFSAGQWSWTGVANPIGTTVGAVVPVTFNY